MSEKRNVAEPKKDRRFFLGAATLAAGGFLAKALGALYRIPLFNILGAEGMGVYQLVFPLYSLLLTFSSSAAPVAVSKLVAGFLAEGKPRDAHRVFLAALALFSVLGLAAGGAMYGLAEFAARAQGRPEAAAGYRMIAPAIALVAALSAFRGYFQGFQRMAPTAASQVLEQLVKLALGLTLAARAMPDVAAAVAGAVAAVTISEIAALLLLAITYLAQRRKLLGGDAEAEGAPAVTLPQAARRIAKVTLPVTLGALILPFSQIVDSLMVINLISRYSAEATGMYGLLTGAVFSLDSLPVSVAFSVAASSVPYLTAAKKRGESGVKAAAPLALTLLIALPAAALYAFLAEDIVRILYPRLASGEFTLLVRLLRLSSLSVLFLALTQTGASCLQGLGKLAVPVVNLAVGVGVKVALNALLLPLPSVNIYGAVISANACYLVAGILNLVYIIRETGLRVRFFRSFLLPAFTSLAAVAVIFLLAKGGAPYLGTAAAFFAAFAVGGAAYLGLTALFYGVNKRHEDHGSGFGRGKR